MPGYRVSPQGGGDLRDELTCSYCKLVLKDAVQTTESGLRFCKECFDKARSDPKFTTLDPNDEVWQDFAVKREIANLKVKCENNKTGCVWKGTFKDLTKHVNDECEYVTIQCKDIKNTFYKIEVIPQDGKEIPSQFLCSYCTKIMKYPVRTKVTSQRFCRSCFDNAPREQDKGIQLDVEDNEIRADKKMESEIDQLKVICQNHTTGCKWKGDYKNLLKHLESCNYGYQNPGCGEQVLLSKIEEHLKDKCLHRQVECKDCDKQMSFFELQEHIKLCSSAPKVCENCKKKIPVSEYFHHITNECKQFKCICNEEDAHFEFGSVEFYHHLKDASKLPDHLAPMIKELSKLCLEFQAAYQLSVERNKELEIKNKLLEENVHQSNKKLERLESDVMNLNGQVKIVQTENAQLKEQNRQLQEKVSSAVAPGHNDQIEALILQVNRVGQQMQQFQQRVGIMEKSYTALREEVTTTETSNSENYSRIIAELETLHQQQEQQFTVALGQRSSFDCEVDYVTSIEDRLCYTEHRLGTLVKSHSELELQFHTSLANTHNGSFLWRIPEVQRRIRDAKVDHTTCIYSQPFSTGRNGYKMCIRAYLNGNGTGKGTHLSIYFVLMRGNYDPLLKWPFDCQVSLILVDQDHKKHFVQTFKPNVQSSSFKRPVSDMNVASGCPEFAELSILDNPSYVKEDVMYIKATVDTSKIFHP